ncbi:SOS response-associated peptidase [Acidovorax sp. SUPP2522]|uniref:SOS response-associated peptidase n=1 Tax=unclassified Acidovorax TaxID=2684926 RepID=UPI0023495EA5|nr:MULTISPECIES: SOS response-associated peptidase [unclassified Acidovorax]WCM97892.1 SOS response-associated peptidase [Acidovorax sp. GBBC 1281]GKT16358.1 SOS response-associated peptidase [Acidovorax sp. SUPP2522]
MTTRYETLPLPETYREAFGVEPPDTRGERYVKPRKPGFFIRAVAPPPGDTESAAGADPDAGSDEEGAPRLARELVHAQWGLVPHWVKSASDGRLRAPKLVNARSETVSTATPFREAWLKGQRCIVPMAAFFEDDWRSGKAVPTRIARVDGLPMAAAGLWARWTGPEGEELVSYTVLTVNANSHALIHRYQPPGSEKRMPALLNEGAYGAWLSARPEKAREFMRQYPANWLLANPVESKADKGPPAFL